MTVFRSLKSRDILLRNRIMFSSRSYAEEGENFYGLNGGLLFVGDPSGRSVPYGNSADRFTTSRFLRGMRIRRVLRS